MVRVGLVTETGAELSPYISKGKQTFLYIEARITQAYIELSPGRMDALAGYIRMVLNERAKSPSYTLALGLWEIEVGWWRSMGFDQLLLNFRNTTPDSTAVMIELTDQEAKDLAVLLENVASNARKKGAS